MGILDRLFGKPGIEPDETDALLAKGAVFLDVRLDEEYVEGHIPDAIHIPLQELSDRISELPIVDTIIVVCRSGARSASAASRLLTDGIQAVNLEGGLVAWRRSGRAVVRPDGTPGVVA